MLRLIMVPLDGSRFAEQALPLALALARRASAKLHLVAVRPSFPLDFAGTEADEYLERVRTQIESELPGAITHRVLFNEMGGLEYPPPASNSVADLLARHAEEKDAGMVIMTTHGRGGLRRAWLGSVADSLARLSSVPVLMVKPHDENFGLAADADRGIQHVIIPLDGSASAERAIPFAIDVGQLFGARYTLLRVMMTLAYTPHHDTLGDYIPELTSPLSRQSIEKYLEDVADPLRKRGLSVATHVAEHGSAAPAIVDYAATHGGSLIAMSTSGAGGMRRLFLGSVADKVVRIADVPVLVCNVHRFAEPTEGQLSEAGAASR
jgi:nucleotide-binding universal stress UspA family protein